MLDDARAGQSLGTPVAPAHAIWVTVALWASVRAAFRYEVRACFNVPRWVVALYHEAQSTGTTPPEDSCPIP